MTTQNSDLSSLLEALAAGEAVPIRNLALFSDLTQADREQVAAVWPTIPAEARAGVFNDIAELEDHNIELDFEQFARVGFKDSDPVVRRLAIEAAWESTDRHVAGDLTRLVGNDPDVEVRYSAATMLANFVLLREYEEFDERQGDEILETLRARYADTSEAMEVRSRALVSLSSRSVDWVDPLITEAYYSDDRIMRLAAVEAMGESARDEWLEYIDEQLLSDDPEFRFQAVASAAEIASPDSVDAVAALLNDDEEDVVLAGIAALGEIGGSNAVEYLEEVQKNVAPDYAEAVEAALEMARNPWRGEEVDDWDEEE